MKELALTIYQAKNGTKFEDKDKCVRYEKFLDFTEDKSKIINLVNDFLSDLSNYKEYGRLNGAPVNITAYVCVDVYVPADNNVELVMLTDKYELDESFAIDEWKWFKFIDKIYKKHGTYLNIPVSYLGQ